MSRESEPRAATASAGAHKLFSGSRGLNRGGYRVLRGFWQVDASPALGERNMPRLIAHPIDPAADCRIHREIETALRRAMRVAEEGNVGDRIARAGKPIPFAQMIFHHGQRRVSLCMPFGSEMLSLLQFLFWRVSQIEPRHRDVRFVAVLFEEHP